MATWPIQASFAKGELTPRLHARVDIDYYKSGLAICSNFYVMRQGGIRRRPGFRYINQSRDQGPAKNSVPALRPFAFSPTQNYVLEFGNLYLRFHTKDGTVMTRPGGGTPYEIVTPWADNDTEKLQFVQINDVIRVTHPNYQPYTIRRYGELDWRILPIVFSDGPYQEIIKDGTVLQPSSNGGIIHGVTSTNTSGVGVASASSEYDSFDNNETGAEFPFPAWQAFDSNGNTEWQADVSDPGEWLAFTFAGKKIVTGYVLGSSPRVESYAEVDGESQTIYQIPGSLRAPRAWVIEGSADGGPWINLDQQSDITGWGEGERRYFTFDNLIKISTIRIRVLEINQSETIARPVSIGTFKFSTGGEDIGLLTFTVSNIASINKGAGFVPGDVGRQIRFLSEDDYWHWFRIINVNNNVSVDAEMYSPPLPSTNGTTNFQLGAFGNAPGWPARVGLFQDRVYYARTDDQPQTVWGSRVDDYDNFTTSIPLVDDDALNLTVAQSGEIQWLLEGTTLLFGTTVAIRSLGPANQNEGFSATNFQQATPLRIGSLDSAPSSVGIAAIFIGRLGTTVHELTFAFDVNGYVAPDMAVLSEHLLRKGIKEMAYSLEPNALMWMVVNDGTLVSMTYERDQKTVALTQHTVGGGGIVETVCVVPGVDRDEVWVSVNRSGTRTIEILEADFDSTQENRATCFYVDCGLTFTSDTPITVLKGLPPVLQGQNVAILADGLAVGTAMVDYAGQLTLPNDVAANVVTVGFPYQSHARTLRPPGQSGSGINAKKVLKKIYIDVLETGDLKAQARVSNASPQQLVTFQVRDDGTPAALRTDNLYIRVDDRWANQGQLDLYVDDPLPCTILQVTPGYEGEP